MNRDLKRVAKISWNAARLDIGVLPMDRNDQQAIGTLFEKLANVERQVRPPGARAGTPGMMPRSTHPKVA